MNKEAICHECGTPIEYSEQFCSNCGATIPSANLPLKKEEDSLIGAGARANVTGGIHKTTTNNTQINTSHTSSSIDNSSNVQHNTTIVMNGKQDKYCEVCGNPLGEKHARCPKCGKMICFECKVRNKNRCVECEKKYINEYRLSFQQLILTTNGNIGLAGRQMMDQKARELDLNDIKDNIEEECVAFHHPQKKEESLIANKTVTGNKRYDIPRTLVTPTSSATKGKKKVSPAIIIAMVIIAIAGTIFLFSNKTEGDNAGNEPPVTKQETIQPVKSQDSNKKETIKNITQKSESIVKETSGNTGSEKKQPTTQTQKDIDSNYEAGMAAYKAGKGLEAIDAFSKSQSAESYYMLGIIYKNGCGTVVSNEMMAYKNFKKAVTMGHTAAKSEL